MRRVVEEGASVNEFSENAREQFTEHLRASGEELVKMAPLRHTFAMAGLIGKPVSLQDRH